MIGRRGEDDPGAGFTGQIEASGAPALGARMSHSNPGRKGEVMSDSLTPGERSLRGRIGAYVLHSRYDSGELTRAARAAFETKFEREVDPDGVLPLEERHRRAEMARKAHYARLALASAEARRKRSRSRP